MKKLWLVFGVSALAVILVFIAFEPLEAQMQEVLHALRAHPAEYALLSFLVLASDVVLPVPSSIVMHMNGAVLGASSGIGLSLLSSLLSAVIGYYIGRLINVRGKSLSQATSNERATSLLHRYGGIAVLVTRGFPVLAESVSIVCGYSRMPLRYYLFLNLLGYLPVVTIYGVFGQLGLEGHAFLLSFICSIGVAALFWALGRKWAMRWVQQPVANSGNTT